MIALADHGGRDDFVGRRTWLLRIDPLELCEHIHSFDHSAKDGVGAIEVWSWLEGQKELRSAGVALGGLAMLRLPAKCMR